MRLTIANYFEVEGKFDSRDRFVKQVANQAQVQFWLTQGRTFDIKVFSTDSGSFFLWRWECGPRSKTPFSPYNNSLAPAAGFATSRAGAY